MAIRKILLIDDDDDLREAIAEQLDLYDEFTTIQQDTACKGVKYARNHQVDMILLDVGLPDLDGREACKLIRTAGVQAPIIMLTGVDGDSDQILGLDAGANDYVTKPCKMNVLLARIRAHLRQHDQSEDATFVIGPYLFKPSEKILEVREEEEGAGRKLRLTEKEANILKYLYRAGGKAVSRDELLAEVWGYNSGVTTHTLETHIYRLRQKVEPVRGRATLLITEQGGYSLYGLGG